MIGVRYDPGLDTIFELHRYVLPERLWSVIAAECSSLNSQLI